MPKNADGRQSGYLCLGNSPHHQFKFFQMKNGIVKFFNQTKGFGFIKENESGNEYFVHVSGLVDQIREGDAVSFEVVEGRKGVNAVNVKLES